MDKLIVVEEKGVREYLEKRNIIKQYKKAKSNLENRNFLQISFKKRQPKSFNGYYFRITGKYRAFGYFKSASIFIVVEINDHQ